MLGPNYDQIRWVAGAVACGLSSSVMGMTNTIHPPGGATALLAAVDPVSIELGWMLVPFILLGATLLTAVACVVNNIQRQFPQCWWTPGTVGRPKTLDIESTPPKIPVSSTDLESKDVLTVYPDRILLPDGISLSSEEEQILEMLRERLKLHQISSKELQSCPSCSSDKTV